MLLPALAMTLVVGIYPSPANATTVSRPHWQIIDLGNLGRPWMFTTAMNDRGDIGGIADTGDNAPHLFFWHEGTLTDLGVRGDIGRTRVTAINNRGQVIGTADTPVQGFLWQHGSLTGLPFVPSDINNRGDIVGGDGQHAWLWRQGIVTDLSPPGATSSTARAINESGEVAISASITVGNDSPARNEGFLWHRGVFTNIGDLGGENTTVDRINDRGDLIGASATVSGQLPHPFLWHNGVMTDLAPPTAALSYAAALNNRAEVVVLQTTQSTLQSVPLLWRNGSVTDLTPPGAGGSGANLINDRGDVAVVGDYFLLFREQRPFLWRDGRSTELPRFEGFNTYQLAGLNQRGDRLAGSAFINDTWHAVRWVLS
jgi:probable HAF family extracellular repeat protein